MPGVIYVNPGSGPDETSVDELRRLFPGHGIQECEPDHLADCVRTSAADGVSFVGIAGGDGTIRTAAEQLAGTGVPLLAIPAGTRNHFARDVGTFTLDDASAAAEPSGTTIDIDLGMVNGRSFVNNSSIGLYPKIVTRRKAREHRLPKGIANLVAGWEQLRHGRRVRIELDGEPQLAWLVFIGNGIYGEGLLDLTDRESLDEHVLDVRVVRADEPLARLRIVGAVMLGRLARSPLVRRRKCRECTINLAQPTVEVALDGEVVVLEPPLRYESVPASLKVRVPPAPKG